MTRDNIYFTDPFMDLAFLHTLTLHGFGGAELGECYQAAAQIADGDPESWHIAWEALARRTEAAAVRAEQRGNRITARKAYLRAVTYDRNAVVAVRPADPRYRQGLLRCRELFGRFCELSDVPIERVEIPYQGRSLPGYLLRPADDGSPRPTIVIGDNVSEELYYWVGPPAMERGYNALLVDLPGIGLNHLDGVEFRPDTEVPVAAVIDYLESRTEVDITRIAVYGGGEPGGYIMTRAASREPRIAACVVDPLVYDLSPTIVHFEDAVLSATRPQDATASLGAILAESGQALIAVGMRDPSVIEQMTCEPSQIACPLLCLSDPRDSEILVAQARHATSAATHPANTTRMFTVEEGTRGYRQLDNFALKHAAMFDWLDTVFENVDG
ncbi:alpha/beta hydrolase family protein [Mycobacterium syngnathidarum]